jgi:hypothetical protein
MFASDMAGSASGAPPPMVGSWMYIRATSAEDAKRKLLADIYTTGGVFVSREVFAGS